VIEEHVFTSAMATARFLALQKPEGTAFVIGEGGPAHGPPLQRLLVVDRDPDYVVVGEGRTFNLELVEAAVRMIHRGAKLIDTNLGSHCRRERHSPRLRRVGRAWLETATGVKAFSVGKPSPIMMRAARKELLLALRKPS